MERYEVEDDGRFAEVIEAARRGDEVVVTQGGEVVATFVPRLPMGGSTLPVALQMRDGVEPRRSIDWAALDALHAALPPSLRGVDSAALVREMRAMDDH